MAGLLLILIIRPIDCLFYAARTVTFPFGLDYAEGPVWQQALMHPGLEFNIGTKREALGPLKGSDLVFSAQPYD